jgi:hypothetical protein
MAPMCPAQVDQVRRLRHAQLHHGDETVPAGEHTAVFAVLGQQRDHFIDRTRPMVFEACWDHISLPSRLEDRSCGLF